MIDKPMKLNSKRRKTSRQKSYSDDEQFYRFVFYTRSDPTPPHPPRHKFLICSRLVDVILILVFPMSFLIFNTLYWYYYLYHLYESYEPEPEYNLV